MKKILRTVLIAAVALATLAGCGDGEGRLNITGVRTEIPSDTDIETDFPPDIPTPPTTTASYPDFTTPKITTTPQLPSDRPVSLDLLLPGKVNLNTLGMIDLTTVKTQGFMPWTNWYDATLSSVQVNSAIHLFDTINTPSEFYLTGIGETGGDFPSDGSGGYIYFALKEPKTVTAYVITTGSEVSAHPEYNPISWNLYATNDPSAMADDKFDPDKWVSLTYVYDGAIPEESFATAGYSIDLAHRGRYQYYCWYVEYTQENLMQVCELELFSALDFVTVPDIELPDDYIAIPDIELPED